ncbi:hypothetical protein N6H13_29420 [Paenibacillus sp. CC-CFT742]|nr:hypothetical protein [Paenibacillus sp. CC-CFT742]WJH28979.1 hypothetical protein N6H13_29420 [Paenibacillus sp. CC-CFT742]
MENEEQYSLWIFDEKSVPILTIPVILRKIQKNPPHMSKVLLYYYHDDLPIKYPIQLFRSDVDIEGLLALATITAISRLRISNHIHMFFRITMRFGDLAHG